MSKVYRQAVMAVIINNQNKVLIGYSPRDKSFKFPQGGLEKNEDQITGLKRELLEELNYTLSDNFIITSYPQKVKYMYPANEHPLYKGQELYVIKTTFNKNTDLSPQDDEFDKLLWILPHEISNYNFEYRFEAYQDALKICGLL